jgi:hypothetical protein
MVLVIGLLGLGQRFHPQTHVDLRLHFMICSR